MTRWRSARVAHRPGDLDAAEHVAAHPVGARQVQRLVVVALAPAEVEHPRVLEEAADDRAHADALGHARRRPAAACRRRARSGRCRRRPAPAAISASISGTSVSALILTTMRAGCPARGRRGDLRDVREHLLVQRERRLQQRAQRLRPAQARELLEHRVGIGGQVGVGGEVADVGVEARGASGCSCRSRGARSAAAARPRAASRAAAWRASSGRRCRTPPARRPPRAARPS